MAIPKIELVVELLTAQYRNTKSAIWYDYVIIENLIFVITVVFFGLKSCLLFSADCTTELMPWSTRIQPGQLGSK